jgi:putative hydrolase
MSDNPTGPGQGDSGDDQPNPFKGTPFEQLFAAFGGAFGGQGAQGGFAGFPGLPGAAGPGGVPDFAALMGQVQALMQPYVGAVNWDLAKDTARRTAAATPDPTVSAGEKSAVTDALQLADHWLDSATEFPSGVTTGTGWSRAEWIEETMPVWQKLVEPVAEHVVAALAQAVPEEAKAVAGPLMGILGQAGGALFGTQVGQAIGGLAGEVLSACDIGLPLGPVGRAALLPANIAAFAEGLDVPLDDVRLYLALREAAHQRLFSQVPWLAAHLRTAVEDYGRGTTIDVSRIEQQVAGFDPSNPAALQEALESGLFEPEKTPTQEAALVRLETVLALVEGWVDEVVSQATAARMPSATKLQELVRRRRAAGGPAETAFAALVGLELRPRRLRDASALWGSLRSRTGAAGRDAVWAHPDLMPTSADLDDPLGFGEKQEGSEAAELDADFDAALAELLDDDARDAGEGGSGDAGKDAGKDAGGSDEDRGDPQA